MEPIYRYIWDQQGKDKFLQTLQSNEYKIRLERCHTNSNYNSDELVEKLTKILHDAASVSLKLKKTTCKTSKHKKRKNFDPTVQKLKREFKNSKQNFVNDHNNLTKRQVFINAKAKYRKYVYAFHKAQSEKNLNKLAELEKKDPKLFWSSLKSMLKSNFNSSENITSNQWTSHFGKLLNVSSRQLDEQFLQYVKTGLPHIEGVSGESGPLDYLISEKEILDCIKDLKNGKANGPDLLLNEMLKCAKEALSNCLQQLFNKILSSSEWPMQWKVSFLTPIFKSGNQCDPNNYRGIAVSCCLNKLLTKILNKRLESFLEENNILNKYQGGYRRKYRTEDNMFIIHTLFQKYVVQNNQKLYVAFVDFRKYFDTINRDLLFYKLLSQGISGHFYRLIKSMYNSNIYRVKTAQGLTNNIQSTSGLKQGCNLSPILANLYQNDLPNIFDSSCNPVQLGDSSFNSLSWADDLLLISTSPAGLQKCLDSLNAYCKKWALEVNPDKTKYMVMCARSIKDIPDVLYNDICLEHVTSFKYLGTVIQQNGKFTLAIKDRIQKANRALFLIKQAISTNHNVSVKLALSLFDKMIAPILFYGCSLWSMPACTNYLYIKNVLKTGGSKNMAQELINSICGKNVDITWARYLRRKDENGLHNILVNMKDYKDKELLLIKAHNHCANYSIENYEFNEEDTQIEKFHNNFCKFVLNVSKKSSSLAAKVELGRYPIYYKAIGHSMKFWHRLEVGTPNVLVNEAFKFAKDDRHSWVQSVESLLNINGLKELFMAPNSIRTSKILGHMIKQRLEDQYVQKVLSKLQNSSRFGILKNVKSHYESSNYLQIIRNTEIRNTYTRLRTDLSILQASKAKTATEANRDLISKCPFCVGEDETVTHFLLYCKKFQNERQNFFQDVAKCVPMLHQLNELDKIKMMLDLNIIVNCIDERLYITKVCKFIHTIYKARLLLKN